MRIAGYVRISKSDESSTSIAKQQAAIRAKVAAKGWDEGGITWFVDEGISGSKSVKRPGRDELESRLGDFDALVINTVDRLARNLVDFVRILDRASSLNCLVIAVNDPIDLSTPMGEAITKILAVFAELEARTISARVQATNSYLTTVGRRGGGRVPYGFQNVQVGPGYSLGQDPKTAPVVQEVITRVLARESVRSITQDLNARGVPSPTGDTWLASSLMKLLRRPVLAGMTVSRGKVVRDSGGQPKIGGWALVDKDTWEKLQTELDRRGSASERRQGAASPALLKGILSCGSCDGGMYVNRAGRQSARYVCSNHRCSAPVVVQKAAMDEFAEGVFLSAVGRMAEKCYQTDGGVDIEALAAVEALISELVAQMADDDADVEMLTERLAELKATRAQIRGSRGPRVVQVSTGRTLAEAWAAEADDTSRNRLLSDSTLRIVVARGQRGGSHALDTSRLTVQWGTSELR